ncbi:MAG: TadE family protein, partial [Ilumatobacteraceae bacterium]
KTDRGAAVLEFALTVPLMLIMLVGIIEFGRAYSVVISLQGAVREGARSLALGDNSSTVDSVVRSSTAVTVDGITQTPCPVAGGTATVKANQLFTFGIPFVPLGSVTLEAKASMRCGL